MLKAVAQLGDVVELAVAVGGGVDGDQLAVHAERETHLVEQAADGAGRYGDALRLEQLGDAAGGAAGPADAGDRIAGGVVFEQDLDRGYDFGRFFSVALRPAPRRRAPSRATSCSSNC